MMLILSLLVLLLTLLPIPIYTPRGHPIIGMPPLWSVSFSDGLGGPLCLSTLYLMSITGTTSLSLYSRFSPAIPHMKV